MKTTYQLNEKKIIFTNTNTSKSNIAILLVLVAIILAAFAYKAYSYLTDLKIVTKIDMLILLFMFVATIFLSMRIVVKPLLWSVYGKEQVYFGKDFLVHRVEYGWFKGKRRVYELYSHCEFAATPASFMTFSESNTDSVLDISTERTKLQTKSKLSNADMDKLVSEITTWYEAIDKA